MSFGRLKGGDGAVTPYAWYFVPHPAQFRAALCGPMDPGLRYRLPRAIS